MKKPVPSRASIGEGQRRVFVFIQGISLIEIVIAIALLAIIATVIAPMFTAASRTWDKDKRLKEQVQTAREAMDFIIYELKKSNGVIDGKYKVDIDPASPSLSTLDEHYIVFSSAGDEIVLDNDNSGYKENGTVNTVREGKVISPVDGSVLGYTTGGGFANDYDASNTGWATYEFKTVLPGLYDVYSYFVATETGTTALVGVFDDTCYDTITADISSTVSQTSTNALKWYQLNCSDASFCANQFGGSVLSLNLTAGGGTGGDCIGMKRTAGRNAIFDAFRLVYRGVRHKVFYYDSVNNKITFGDDDVDNDGNDGNDAFASLSNNTALIDNIYPLSSTTSIFTYWTVDGATPVDSGGDPKEVALIKIAFQLVDPEGKLPPYPLRGQVMLTPEPSSRRLVINEIFKEENETEIAEERFDGNSNGDGDSGAGDNAPFVAGQADGGWYGFSTEHADIDGDGDNEFDMNGDGVFDNDGWLSTTETFSDGNITGWTNVDCADGGEACVLEADAGDNVLSITATDASDNTGSFFYEPSRNYVAVFDFRVICNERQTFSFRTRHVDTTDHIGVEFYVDDNDNAACLRVEREMNGATDTYPAAADPECDNDGVKIAELDDGAIGNYDIYDDAEWHRMVIVDGYYTITAWLSEGSATRAGLDALTSVNYTRFLNWINYDPAADRLDAYDVAGACGDAPCPGVKGFEIDDTLNGTAGDDNACAGGAGDDAAHIHFDNVRIWSTDWKPIGYLTSFDDTNTVWDTDSGTFTTFIVRASVDPAFGPQGDHTTGVGGTGKVLTSARDTNSDELMDVAYSANMNGLVEHRNIGQITLGNHVRDMGDVGAGNMPYFTFQYWYWWQWMDMDPDDDDACGFAMEDANLVYPGSFAAEGSLHPVDQSACPNSYGANPTLVYDADPDPPLNPNPFSNQFNTELWTRDHACWVRMRMDLSTSGFTSAGNHDIIEMAWRFGSDADGADGAGWFIDDVEYYPGGIWNIQDEDGADNYKSRATHTGRTVLSTGADNGSYADFGNGDEDWLHAAVESPLVRITDAQDFNAVKVRFYLLMDMSDTAGEDGLFIQYSIDGGAWTSVSSDQNSYFTQDGYDGTLACNDPYDPGDNAQNDVGCNESAFFTDRTNWTEVAFVVEDDTLIDGGTFRFRYQFTSDDGGNGADGVLIDSIRVYGLQRNYQFIEVYNPTPHTVDLDGSTGTGNWRIVTDGHTGSADTFDAIRGFGNVNAPAIPPGGYAVITQRSAITRFYDGLYFTAPPASAVRLEIDDDFFGFRGLGTEFGAVTLQDNTGAIVDNVNYNVVFYDQLDNYAAQTGVFTTMDAAMYNWSTASADGGNGDVTQFYLYNPTKQTTGGNRGPGRDHTSGRYGLDTGLCFILRQPGAGTKEEDYDEDDAVELRSRGLDLSQTTAANAGNLEFWYFLNTDDTDDGFIVQLSSQGGNNLTIPFTGQPNGAPEGECEGKIKDGQTEGDDCRTGTDRLNPNYNGVISTGTSSLDFGTGQRAYHTDQFGWRKVTATLNDFVGGYSLLRFYWEADNTSGGTRPGLYLDDIVVWFHWGGGVFQKTLEKKSWRGDSNKSTNWGTSTPNYGTPGYFNSIAY